MSYENTADEITAAFENQGIDVDSDEVASKLQTMNEQFSVTGDDAAGSVIKQIAGDHSSDGLSAAVKSDYFNSDSSGGSNESVVVADIPELDEPGTPADERGDEWFDLTAKVTNLFESDKDSIAQVGTLADESGSIRFVLFESSKENGDLPTLEEGESYEFESVISDYYKPNQSYSVKIVKTSDIENSEADIDTEQQFTGTITAFGNRDMDNAGLIQRCSEEGCNRVLKEGKCSEHGDVEGEYDLRIAAVIDDGQENYDLYINDDDTIAELFADNDDVPATLEAAKDAAQEAYDTTVVAEAMADALHGRVLSVTGQRDGGNFYADEVTEVTEAPNVEDALVEARSLAAGMAEE